MDFYYFNENLDEKQKNLLLEIFNCNDLTTHEKFIGKGKGRKTVSFLNTKNSLGFNVVHKNLYHGGLWGKIAKNYYFGFRVKNFRAVIEFNLLNQMQKLNLPTSKAVAVKISKIGFIYKAWIITELLENCQTLKQILEIQSLGTDIFKQIGATIAQFHKEQIYHSDLNIHNILINQAGKIFIIDFDKCNFKQGENWKLQNLNRLHRSFMKEKKRHKIHFNEQNWHSLQQGWEK